MKKGIFIWFVAAAIVTVSCKKKKADTPPANTTTTTTSLSYYGELYSNEFVSVIGTTISPSSGVSGATFPSQGFIETGPYAGGFF